MSVIQISTEQHQKPWNVGRCPQRLHCYQMIAGWVSRWQFYWKRSMCFCGVWAWWSENKLSMGFQWPVCTCVCERTCTWYIVRTRTRLQSEDIFRKASITWLICSPFNYLTILKQCWEVKQSILIWLWLDKGIGYVNKGPHECKSTRISVYGKINVIQKWGKGKKEENQQ